jgi:Cu(I)/Ag(I) efflux system membrane fusion protein
MTALRTSLRWVALIGTGALLAAAGYLAGSRQSAPQPGPSGAGGATAAKIDPKTGRAVLYWHDPMVPGQKFDQPGKSPFMDMPLVPVFADEAAGADSADKGGVRVPAAMQQNLGMREATVRRAEVGEQISAVGSTQLDDSLAEVVQSRVTGYIERLHARTPLQPIRRGAPVATLFVPDWLAPQEEFLALKRRGDTELADAARQRMRALSIPESLIAQLEKSGQPQRQLTLYAPASGVITELPLREGAMVSPGMTMATITGLGQLWLIAEVPETLAPRVHPGMKASAQFPGRPERSYSAVVRDVLPQLNPATRTVQARLVLDNRDGSLRAGLLMQVRLGGSTATRLLVPTEAVIQTGRRAVVLVVGEQRRIRPVTVTVGREHGDESEILDGLSEGQKVIVSGQFLIDSEASLKSALTKFDENQPPTPTTAKAAPLYHATGRIEQVTPDALTLAHGPVPALQWGAMTMDFAKPSPDAFKQFRRGDRVSFSFHETDDGYLLDSVEPATAANAGTEKKP